MTEMPTIPVIQVLCTAASGLFWLVLVGIHSTVSWWKESIYKRDYENA